MNAPAFATHGLVLTVALAAYLYNIGDVHYAGWRQIYIKKVSILSFRSEIVAQIEPNLVYFYV